MQAEIASSSRNTSRGMDVDVSRMDVDVRYNATSITTPSEQRETRQQPNMLLVDADALLSQGRWNRQRSVLGAKATCMEHSAAFCDEGHSPWSLKVRVNKIT